VSKTIVVNDTCAFNSQNICAWSLNIQNDIAFNSQFVLCFVLSWSVHSFSCSLLPSLNLPFSSCVWSLTATQNWMLVFQKYLTTLFASQFVITILHSTNSLTIFLNYELLHLLNSSSSKLDGFELNCSSWMTKHFDIWLDRLFKLSIHSKCKIFLLTFTTLTKA
jgi:hypothetical protein